MHSATGQMGCAGRTGPLRTQSVPKCQAMQHETPQSRMVASDDGAADSTVVTRQYIAQYCKSCDLKGMFKLALIIAGKQHS